MAGVAKPKRLKWWGWALIVLCLAIVARIGSSNTPPAITPAAATTPAFDEHQPHAVSAGFVDEYVKPHLKDPDSATYRNLSLRRRRSVLMICGEVNSKNSFGGYTGYRQFTSMIGSDDFTIDEGEGAKGWYKEWNTWCVHTDDYDKAHGLDKPLSHAAQLKLMKQILSKYAHQ